MTMNMPHSSSALFILLALRLVFAGSDIPTSRISPPKRYSGKVFASRQYPSLAELPSVSLQELIKLRPTPLYEPEKKHFYSLFAQHPTIKKQNLGTQSIKEFKQGWIDLWCGKEDRAINRHDKKLPHCIEKHLERDASISPQLRIDIVNTCKRLKANATQRSRYKMKRISENPADVEWQKQQREMRKKYNARRLSNGEYGALQARHFEKMLHELKISTQLPADHIELLTREHRGSLDGLRSTTTAMRHFFRIRNQKNDKWQQAIDTRKAYNEALFKKQFNRKYRLNKIHLNNYEDHENVETEQSRLLRASTWWLI